MWWNRRAWLNRALGLNLRWDEGHLILCDSATEILIAALSDKRRVCQREREGRFQTEAGNPGFEEELRRLRGN